MFVESLQEMTSHMQKNYRKYDKDEVHESSRGTAEPIHIQEDKYVAADEKPCTFKGTFSDSEDELDTKFVCLMSFIIENS